MNRSYIIIFESPSDGYLFKFKKLFDNIVVLSGSPLYYIVYGLPKKKKIFIVLKSPHIYKKSQEHFEKTRSRICFHICYNLADSLKFERFLNLISWSLFGVSVKKIKIEKKFLIF